MKHVIPSTINTIPRFQDMYNIIHVDEKWFFMSKTSQTFYLAPHESQPYRTTKSKRFICKIMFETVVARPQFSEDGTCLFDGKIGVFPLTEVVPAKWPLERSTTIWIQQDNATPHMALHDEEFRRAATQDGFDIHLIAQPPNSPDTNVLDLGFFRAIQSIQHEQAPRTVDELVEAVKYAYESFDPRKLNHVFLSLQYVMLEIMKVGGCNNYQLPHHAKLRQERMGELPETVHVPKQLLQDCMTSLLGQYIQLNGMSTIGIQEQEGEDVVQSTETYLAQEEDIQMNVDELEVSLSNMYIS